MKFFWGVFRGGWGIRVPGGVLCPPPFGSGGGFHTGCDYGTTTTLHPPALQNNAGEKDSWGLRKDDHTVEAGFLIGTLVLVDIVSVVVIISNAVAIAMRLANPDFYAILILLNLVR